MKEYLNLRISYLLLHSELNLLNIYANYLKLQYMCQCTDVKILMFLIRLYKSWPVYSQKELQNIWGRNMLLEIIQSYHSTQSKENLSRFLRDMFSHIMKIYRDGTSTVSLSILLLCLIACTEKKSWTFVYLFACSLLFSPSLYPIETLSPLLIPITYISDINRDKYQGDIFKSSLLQT